MLSTAFVTPEFKFQVGTWESPEPEQSGTKQTRAYLNATNVKLAVARSFARELECPLFLSHPCFNVQQVPEVCVFVPVIK